MLIPVRNLILLWDHPEGCNKIQDNNKDQIYVIISHHNHKNGYWEARYSLSKSTVVKCLT